MKKILYILCVVAVIFFPISSHAEKRSVDLADWSVEELLALKHNIDDVLLSKNGSVELFCGDYMVGRDIAPGSYTINFLEKKPFGGDTEITVYNSINTKAKYESLSEDYEKKFRFAEETYNKNLETLGIDSRETESRSTISIELPEAIDGSQYYAMKIKEYRLGNASVHVSIEEGQLLSVSYDADRFFATIEKSTGIFMD